MSELTTTSDRVRDLTAAPRRMPIEVEGNVTHDVILAIWTVFSDDDTHSGKDLGDEWIDAIREKTPEDLSTEIRHLGGTQCHAWLPISSLLLSAPHPHDPDRMLGWLESVDDNRLRRWVIGYVSHSDDQALIEQAAAGDVESIRTLVGEKAAKKPDFVDHLVWLVETDGLATRYAAAVNRFRKEVFAEFEEEFAGAISRAAAARRAAPVRGSAKEVIEEVTSGLDFDIPVGISRVVLVPSVVTRPLSLIDGHRGTLIVYYGVADEFVDSDPEAPPSWLVRMYKALSDDKRLRILRRLSEGETSLDELTDLLGLSKSTVHHHLSQLRGAGLVRVRIPSDDSKSKHKHYTLREQSLADAGAFLDSYLRTGDLEERHA